MCESMMSNRSGKEENNRMEEKDIDEGGTFGARGYQCMFCPQRKRIAQSSSFLSIRLIAINGKNKTQKQRQEAHPLVQ
jgi:hypothetical protein